MGDLDSDLLETKTQAIIMDTISTFNSHYYHCTISRLKHISYTSRDILLDYPWISNNGNTYGSFINVLISNVYLNFLEKYVTLCISFILIFFCIGHCRNTRFITQKYPQITYFFLLKDKIQWRVNCSFM